MHVLFFLTVLALALAVAAVVLRLVFRLPRRVEAYRASVLLPHPGGLLSRIVGQLAEGQEDKTLSAVYPLPVATDALAVRIQLIRAATQSLDLQYYIWHLDASGQLLLNELFAAATRGVRVRLLLDDNGISGMDAMLARMNMHPNIQVRLFNPFPIRRPKFVSWLISPRKLNRRMHNKSMTADGMIAVVGGRNVGDEYFGVGEGVLFADLDVMVAGPVVRDVVHDFETYWDSEASFAISWLVSAGRMRRTAGGLNLSRHHLAQRYLETLEALPSLEERMLDPRNCVRAGVRMVSDSPLKVTVGVPQDQLLFSRLIEYLGQPVRKLDLVSAYFVPGREARHRFAEMARSGVDIRVLTNSFAATDVAIVHCGYAPARLSLLRMGVRLYEMKRGGLGGRVRKYLMTIGGSQGGRTSGMVPRSRVAALHAKTFAVDDRTLFVGSFNFDPRSIALNTELGFVIDSPKLARELDRVFQDQMADWSYKVGLKGRNRLYWEEWGVEGKRILHRLEPGTTLLSRTMVRLVSLLPIQWLL